MAEISIELEKAFDYRGDVTLKLKDGREVVGFVFNRESEGSRRCAEPFIEVMLAGGTDTLLFKYSEIVAVTFTGEDTAAGKSWEEWQIKENARKQAAGALK